MITPDREPGTAVILVDLQNAFCRETGSFRRRGFQIPGLAGVIEANRALRTLAGRRDWPVIFTRLSFRPDYSDAGRLAADDPRIRELHAYQNDSDDSRIIDELAPGSGDLVIAKTRFDPFIGTRLEAALREQGIDRVVVGGVLTNVCVESTIRSAYDRDFRVVVVREATASCTPALHDASLATMARYFARVCDLASLRAEKPH